jgi:hypothetical protein
VRAQIRASWGEPLFLDRMAPSVAHDEPFRRWWVRLLRMSASPGAAIAHHRAGATGDVCAVLPAIRTPTLVIRRAGDVTADAGEVAELARRIPGATLVEMPGDDHLPFVGDAEALLDRVRDFLGGPGAHGQPPDDSWMVAAVVSLAPHGACKAEEAPPGTSDADPVQLLCEREVARFRGIELDGRGRGRAVAMFDGPMRAVRFARAVLSRVRLAGVELAAGVCFGACHLGDADVEGAAPRTAPEVAARAEPGEVLVTGPVQALLAGSGLSFAERGSLDDGVPLFAVQDGGSASIPPPQG